MAAVFDFLPTDESARRAAAIDALVLDGDALTADVAQAIQDIPFERTIEGASTVTLALIDPDGELLDSGLFSAAVDIELPISGAAMTGYRLVRFKTAGAILSLEFEDRAVNIMRGHKEVRHASRADVTRAEFIRTLVRALGADAGVSFWSPELHIQQPIKSVRDAPTRTTKQTRRVSGFGSATPKVKGKDATRQQIGYLELALDTAVTLKANRQVMIGLVEAMTQESVVHNDVGQRVGAGNPGGDSGGLVNVGVLHQSSAGWPASRDVPRDVTAFLRKMIPTEKANRDKTVGWCVDQVQRSYTFNTGAQGRDYDQWVDEARDTVNAYTGADPSGDRRQSESVYRKRYEYRTTEPNADHREDWWSATGRLASEVNFRRFVDLGVFHYASDDYLRKAAARLILDRRNLPAGVLNVDIGDFDTGKPRRNVQGQNVGGAEIRVDILTDVLTPAIGSVWIVKGYGPADGRYLVENMRGSYLSPRATVTITLPVPSLPEPAPTTGTRAAGDPAPSGPQPNGLTPKQIIDQIVLPIARANHIAVTPQSVEAANARHGATKGGSRSDHQGPPTVAWAADMSNGVMTKEEDALAKALARRFDMPSLPSPHATSGPHPENIVSITHNGYRYQLIYRMNTEQAGNHYNHVHFGVRIVGRPSPGTPQGKPNQPTAPNENIPTTPTTTPPVDKGAKVATIGEILKHPSRYTAAQVATAKRLTNPDSAGPGTRRHVGVKTFRLRVALDGSVIG